MGKEYIRSTQILGSTPIFGKIILFDDFSNNYSWTSHGDAGYVIKRIPSIFLSPPCSLHMATNNVATETVYISKNIHVRPSNEIKMTVPFLMDDVSLCAEIEFRFQYYDGTNLHIASFKWIASGTKWQYMTSAGTYSDVPGGTQALLDNAWNRLEFSLNRNLGTFISFLNNNLLIDMSSYSYRQEANAGAAHLYTSILTITNANTVLNTYIDAVLISED